MSQVTDFKIPWDKLQTKANSLVEQLTTGSLDTKSRSTVQKELTSINKLLAKHKDIETVQKEAGQIKEQLSIEQDAELKELYSQELESLESKNNQLNSELAELLFPPNDLDTRSAFLEIRAGTGGQEASLFAADLAKMYMNYGLKRGWQVSVTDSSTTDLGGFREVVLHIEGKNVYGDLRFESGVHRVQRVPATETQGRIHTSTATVALLPEAEEIDVTIDPSDLRIDVYRASGAGGQHVNKTESAIRITHLPTGVVVSCQDERSQHKNKNKAMKMLQSRLLVAQEEKQQAETSQARKELVGGALRSEKVRTYNYPQNRITDHQIDLTLKKLDVVMQGNLDEIIDALRQASFEKRRNNLPEFITSLQS